MESETPISVQMVLLTEDARGLRMRPTPMVRVILQSGAIKAHVDIEPEQFLRFGHMADAMVTKAIADHRAIHGFGNP